MIFNAENTKGKKVKIYDAKGTEIKAVLKYNTRTREADIMLTGLDASGKRMVISALRKTKYMTAYKPITVRVKIPGSFTIVDGKKY